MNLENYQPDFLKSLSSPKTVQVYKTYTSYYLYWLTELHGRPPVVSDITSASLRAYQEHRAAIGVIANTRRLEISCLRTFFRYLLELELISSLPFVRLPKAEPQHRTVPTDSEVFALRDACERFSNPSRAALCHLIVRLFMHTGIRRTELLSLNVSDLSTERKQIIVQCGKGGKSRRIPVCEELRDAYCAYLALRPAQPSTRLLLTSRGAMSDKCLTSLIDDLRARSEQKEKEYLQPHALRHWAACNWRRRGTPLEKIQEWLGHESLATTQTYLQGLGADIEDYAEFTSTKKRVQAEKPTTRHRHPVRR